MNVGLISRARPVYRSWSKGGSIQKGPQTSNSFRNFASTARSSSIPPNSWDSHTHITVPPDHPSGTSLPVPVLPSSLSTLITPPSAEYKPHAVTLLNLRSHLTHYGFGGVLLTQPSPFGVDNSTLLAALAELNGLGDQSIVGRGVVVIEPSSSAVSKGEESWDQRWKSLEGRQILSAWHMLGVRGVRINLKSVSREVSPAELRDLVARHADVIREAHLGDSEAAIGGSDGRWSVQLHTGLESVPTLVEEVKRQGVKIVVDHLGLPGQDLFPGLPDASAQDIEAAANKRRNDEGWQALLQFLRDNEDAYVKVSAPYRVIKSPTKREAWDPKQWPRLQGLVEEVMNQRSGRGGIFATDWPHTRFEGLEIENWGQLCAEWIEEETTREMLFKENATRAFG